MYLNRSLAVGALSAGLLAVMAGCERPPTDAEQQGHRGTGMEDVDNPRIAEENADLHVAPEPADSVSSEGPKAGEVYQNVEVLDDLSVAEFTRLMQSMTDWVAPEEGCTYCHDGNDFASEELYTYQVSRQMLEMNRYVNANWDTHMGDNGVTCYTCHRGENIPEESWFEEPESDKTMVAAGLGNSMMQNLASDKPAYASLPRNAFESYLLGHEDLSVEGQTILPNLDEWDVSLQDTEKSYSLMMHMSDSIGGNCTTCHNTGRLGQWDESPVEREISWHGIRMTRDMNVNFIQPLEDGQPDVRLGPTGDIAKVNCSTCHYGEQLPLNGTKMVEDYPGLVGEEDEDFDFLQFGDLGTEGLEQQ
ncbi:MAG: photosynthetic reaction center cytochrome PufC [Halorhodospira sp.]